MDTQHLDTILIVMVAVYGASVLLQVGVLAGAAWGMTGVIAEAASMRAYCGRFALSSLP